MQTRDSRPRAFTLIELLIVIAVVGIVAGPALFGRPGGPRGRAPGPVYEQPPADRTGRCTTITVDADLPDRSDRGPPSTFPRTTEVGRLEHPCAALALPEQTPLFNAANFSWNPDQQGAKQTGLGAHVESNGGSNRVGCFPLSVRSQRRQDPPEQLPRQHGHDHARHRGSDDGLFC